MKVPDARHNLRAVEDSGDLAHRDETDQPTNQPDAPALGSARTWFNHHRLLEVNGDLPPIELERAAAAPTDCSSLRRWLRGVALTIANGSGRKHCWDVLTYSRR